MRRNSCSPNPTPGLAFRTSNLRSGRVRRRLHSVARARQLLPLPPPLGSPLKVLALARPRRLDQLRPKDRRHSDLVGSGRQPLVSQPPGPLHSASQQQEPRRLVNQLLGRPLSVSLPPGLPLLGNRPEACLRLDKVRLLQRSGNPLAPPRSGRPRLLPRLDKPRSPVHRPRHLDNRHRPVLSVNHPRRRRLGSPPSASLRREHRRSDRPARQGPLRLAKRRNRQLLGRLLPLAPRHLPLVRPRHHPHLVRLRPAKHPPSVRRHRLPRSGSLRSDLQASGRQVNRPPLLDNPLNRPRRRRSDLRLHHPRSVTPPPSAPRSRLRLSVRPASPPRRRSVQRQGRTSSNPPRVRSAEAEAGSARSLGVARLHLEPARRTRSQTRA
jgi:hypothetical protein